MTPNATRARMREVSTAAEDFDALRRTVYGEARNQPFAGQVAVAWVVINRARHEFTGWWGTSIQEVCYKPFQFSCHNPGDPNKKLCEEANESLPTFLKASTAAAMALTGLAKDPTGAATHYHTIQAPAFGKVWPPKWTVGAKETKRIGDHVFYTSVP